MTDVPEIEIRCEELPGRKSYALIVCDLPDGREAILGVGHPEAEADQLMRFRRRLAVEARKAAAVYVVGWDASPITNYLLGFKEYDLDAEDRVTFGREVVERLVTGLRDDDPFRVAAALTAELGLSADKRIIGLIEPLLEEVNEVRQRADVVASAAKILERTAIHNSPMLVALLKERRTSAGPKP